MMSKKQGGRFMRKLSMIFALLLLVSLLAACGEATPTTAPATTPATQYTVRVQDADGNPVADALVAICQAGEGGICYMPSKTGADGTVTFPENAVPVQNNMKVRVLSAPGYDLPVDENGEIIYTMIPDGTATITLILNKLPA
jgi:hypothetical protein